MPMLEEALRRRLLQTAALYIAVAWGGTEILAFLIDALAGEEASDKARRYLAILLIAGFPAAMYLAWTKDLGLKARRMFSAGAVAILIVAVLVYTLPEPQPDGLGSFTENSIAILPFDVCEERASDRPLAGGLTGAVFNRLAQRDRLKVMGRRSVERVSESVTSLASVAGLLGVEYLLNGILCRDGIDLTLHAELTDNNGFVVWEEEFRQVVNQADQVEQQLASLIENGVAAELGDVIVSSPDVAVDRRALEQLLIGDEYFDQDEKGKARAAYEKALEIQPDYAEAKRALAATTIWGDRTDDNWSDSMRRGLPVVEEALAMAEEHLLRDPQDFRANRVAGALYRLLAYLERELSYRDSTRTGEEITTARRNKTLDYYANAERHFRAALAINPADTGLRIALIGMIEEQGIERRKEALDILLQALDTEPFNPDLAVALAWRLMEFGRLREAMEQLDRFDVLPRGKGDLATLQAEILWDAKRYDEMLSYLIEDLYDIQDEPGSTSAPDLLWIIPSHIPTLGLFDEAADLHGKVAMIPVPGLSGYPLFAGRTAYQFFFEDRYRRNTGRGDELARERLQRFEDMSDDEILKGWYLSASVVADDRWRTGDRERAIELYEPLRHYEIYKGRWAHRQFWYAARLVFMYMQFGREDDAAPVLREIIDYLQNEVDHGMRHPQPLMRLAGAYAWLGDNDAALDMLDLAIDYGGYDTQMCCMDYLPQMAHEYAGDRNWWDGLEGDPRFIQSKSRMRAIVDQQRSNIRALLTNNDMDTLLAPLMEMGEAETSE